MPSSTGALPPHEAAEVVLQNGIEHLEEPLLVTVIQNIYGALLLSAGGLLSLVLGAGFPEFTEENPGLQRLLQGAAFPLGLVLVYFVGAGLFTGYPMFFTVAALSRKGRPAQYVRGVVASWVSNLVGALLASLLFSYATDALSQSPWKAQVQNQVLEDIIELQWHVIFLRAIGCGWLVTIAMYLGNQNQDGISKALCMHFPFMISAVARFPHTVEYMYLVSTGMLLGAPLSVGGFFWKCLLPITLGNTVGGSLLTGLYLWVVHLKGHKELKDRLGNGDLLGNDQ